MECIILEGEKITKKKNFKLYRKLINLLEMDLEKVTTFLLHRIES